MTSVLENQFSVLMQKTHRKLNLKIKILPFLSFIIPHFKKYKEFLQTGYFLSKFALHILLFGCHIDAAQQQRPLNFESLESE